MTRALAIIALVALAGCKDNGPDRLEREAAMRDCVGVIGRYDVRDAPQDIRLACTQAIYGGNTNDQHTD